MKPGLVIGGLVACIAAVVASYISFEAGERSGQHKAFVITQEQRQHPPESPTVSISGPEGTRYFRNGSELVPANTDRPKSIYRRVSERSRLNREAASRLRLMDAKAKLKASQYHLQWVPDYWLCLPGQVPALEVAPNLYAPAFGNEPALWQWGQRPAEPHSLFGKKAIFVKE